MSIGSQISEISNVFLKHSDDKIYNLAGDLLSAYVEGLVSIYPVNYHPFLPSFVANQLDYNQYRGSISQQTEGTNMEIKWYSPNETALSIVKDIVNEHLYGQVGKEDAKKKISISIKIIQAIVSLQAVEANNPGSFRISTGIENLNVPVEISQAHERFAEILKGLTELGIQDDPIIAESIIKLISSTLKHPSLNTNEVKLAESKLRNLRNKIGNPLVTWKERNSSETRFYQIEKAVLHHNLRIATRLSQKQCTGHYQSLIDALIKLTMHPLKSTRSKAKKSLEEVLTNNFLYGQEVISTIWRFIESKATELMISQNEEEMKALFELIGERGVLWKRGLITNMYLQSRILMEASKIDNNELQIPLFGVFSNYVLTAYPNVKISANGKVELLESHISQGRQIISRMCNEIPNYH